MKKTTARLIVTAVIVMILLNGILVVLLWNRQSPMSNQKRLPVTELNEFIIQEMSFDEASADKFRIISQRHHENQMQHHRRYREVKHQLNLAMLDQDSVAVERLLNDLAKAVKTKELELFRFFSDVSQITTREQQMRFGKIFREASGAPEYERIPMDGVPNRPHPPKH